MRANRLESGAAAAARAEAARDVLHELGAVHPEEVASLLVPWTS
jgi:hypothetical protein